MKRKKYQLPIVAVLEQIKVDLPSLRSAARKIESFYVDVRTANPALCDNHMTLSNQVYDNFRQINLTELSQEPMPFTANIKERILRREETLYNKPTSHYKGSYFEQLISQFKAPAMRVRITKLEPGSQIPFHIDYDPSYATRVIIPINSNAQVKNLFKVKNEILTYHLQPGKAYFLNTGFSHSVINDSSEDRIALMFSLDGQEDIVNL
jgi:hypothetical protein